MRIRRLDLLRYGKFTDRSLDFPPAAGGDGPRDFHLIVGANEAGKSTTRSAILDLLFGIEHVTAYDFLHAKETRLGATLEHAGATLEFVRTKTRVKSLFDPSGAALGESALAPFIGSTDRAFFDQMFGLDHPRLVAGGRTILSASSDVGQILFQSAAGVGSLGVVRDQLEAEADKLWARRRSGERAYYIASDQLARADAALKAATVRTKDWLDARGRVQDLEDRREMLRGGYRALEAERIRLERVRRVASALRQLRKRQAELRQLETAVLLPPDAARQLAETELELAGAERDHALHAGQASEAHAQRERIRLDELILKHEADIVALTERRQQIRGHGREIDRRLLEIDVVWQQVLTLVRQLGWTAASEDDLSDRLPGLPARVEVTGLAKRFGVIEQARQTAVAAATDKAAELQAVQAQLDGLSGLSAASLPPALRAELAAARALGDPNAAIRRAEAQLDTSRRELAAALAGLGGFRVAADLEALRRLRLPSADDIRQRRQRQLDADATRKTLAAQLADLDAGLEAQQLEITQYRNAHRPVSLGELAEVRVRRDALWNGVKSAAAPIAAATADAFEQALRAADSLSDQRHDKAREVSELQARLDALQRLQLQAADNAARRAANDAEMERLSADWAGLSAGLGLAGLPLQDVEAWRGARDNALRAADALAEAERELAVLRQTAGLRRAALVAALGAAGVGFDAEAAFDTLVLTAADAVDSAAAAGARFDELRKQRQAAAAALDRQRDKAASAQAERDAWSSAWRAATAGVGLPETVDVGTAEAALSLLAQIDTALKDIREIRRNRIEAMQRDLADFEREAAQLSAAAAPDLRGQSGVEIATELAARLAGAQNDWKEVERLTAAAAGHEAQTVAATTRIGEARARLQPLLQQAGVASLDALRGPIARSDQRRLVEAAAAAAQRAVEEGGDGLSVEALEAEVAATDPAGIALLIADTAEQIDAVRHEQDALTAELTQAAVQLARIAGQDDAARAESQRQDALAQMANAAERYVKVHTASRLLKWAIDRYRETRQGPMLTRAGEIFSMLTLGSFQKLVVDFDSEPLALHGLRAEGGMVGVDGMSDGTRDQLYLALRLAALELHLAHGHALPFIADDLFVNYDDRRAKAGLQALARLAEHTQVIFLSHHDHLVPTVQAVFGAAVNVVVL